LNGPEASPARRIRPPLLPGRRLFTRRRLPGYSSPPRARWCEGNSPRLSGTGPWRNALGRSCSRGAAALSDAELLAIFLRTGLKGKTAVSLARDMLAGFGGLRALLEADLKTFCLTKGLGTAKYLQLQASLEISRRYPLAGLSRGDALTDPKVLRDYLQARLRGYRDEVFACLFLDSRLRAISFYGLFHGTIDAATVYPREVVKPALMHRASAVVMAHQHPSGIAQPSRADKVLTRRLRGRPGAHRRPHPGPLRHRRHRGHLLRGGGPTLGGAPRCLYLRSLDGHETSSLFLLPVLWTLPAGAATPPPQQFLWGLDRNTLTVLAPGTAPNQVQPAGIDAPALDSATGRPPGSGCQAAPPDASCWWTGRSDTDAAGLWGGSCQRAGI